MAALEMMMPTVHCCGRPSTRGATKVRNARAGEAASGALAYLRRTAF